MEMIDRPVGDVLKGKSSPNLLSLPATATVAEAVALMDEKGLGSVRVADEDGPQALFVHQRHGLHHRGRRG